MDELAAGRRTLLRLYDAAVRAVDGRAAVRRALATGPAPRATWLLALGKAAESMTLGALDALGGRCRGGLLIARETPSGQRVLEGHDIAWMVGGHPVPDEASLIAGSHLLEHLSRIPAHCELLFLLSGGASSLVEVPGQGIGLDTLRRANRWLLGSGLPIADMNRVRTALSLIKGGGLLSFLPERPVRVLAISDVRGDDPAVIGSGPLVPQSGLEAYLADLVLPGWLEEWTTLGLTARRAKLPPGPAVQVVARLADAKSAAAEAGRRAGLSVQAWEAFLDGDAAVRGTELARVIRDGPPGLQVWGGETTVRLPRDPGRGGRSQHLALAAAMEFGGRGDCLLLAAGTDGSDGNTEDAGALVDGGTLARGTLEGLDPRDCLARADSGHFLAASGDLIQTGPTGTNVMDLVLGLRLGADRGAIVGDGVGLGAGGPGFEAVPEGASRAPSVTRATHSPGHVVMPATS